jgi:hypothetical protein
MPTSRFRIFPIHWPCRAVAVAPSHTHMDISRIVTVFQCHLCSTANFYFGANNTFYGLEEGVRCPLRGAAARLLAFRAFLFFSSAFRRVLKRVFRAFFKFLPRNRNLLQKLYKSCRSYLPPTHTEGPSSRREFGSE